MTDDEKQQLIRGDGWNLTNALPGYYVGNVAAIERLGIPAIHLQDAGQGFRNPVAGTDAERLATESQVTAWPSTLAVAATWDAALVRRWGEALGEEFKAKGANVILGPGVQVHRVPRGGRNAEYLSGEDPYLGALLVPSYVQGVQSRGVAAVAKHFALNSQEFGRYDMSSDASDRTLWEVYYPPFEAAVEAGVAGVMCGYNLVNGTHACGNHKLLMEDLKSKMMFGGFVVSDWWATPNTWAAGGGLDMEMPGTARDAQTPAMLNATLISRGRLDNMVTRIVRGMTASGAFDAPPGDGCAVGGGCDEYLYHVNASTEGHVRLAREIAAASVVLLKNDELPLKPALKLGKNVSISRRVLPLVAGNTVALAGTACHADHRQPLTALSPFGASDYTVMGGSGRVVSDDVYSLTQALLALGIELLTSPSNSAAAAQKIASRADVIIACAGATAHEGEDRKHLYLEEHNFLTVLSSRADQLPPIIVVATAPGAFVTTPWIDQVDAALALFLGGQQTGAALVQVLYGLVNPTGRLPVTLLRDGAAQTPPCIPADPGGDAHCVYEEGVFVSWRRLIDGGYFWKVSFPFGFGLSFTSFEYSWQSVPRYFDGVASLQVRVRNSGTVPGADVVQLYIRFPFEATHSCDMRRCVDLQPDLVLRGFEKTTELQPGEDTVVCFTMGSRDLAFWDESLPDAHGSAYNGTWRVITGEFTALVGASAKEIRLRHPFMVPA